MKTKISNAPGEASRSDRHFEPRDAEFFGNGAHQDRTFRREAFDLHKIEGLLRQCIGGYDREALIELLVRHDVPVAPVNDLHEPVLQVAQGHVVVFVHNQIGTPMEAIGPGGTRRRRRC